MFLMWITYILPTFASKFLKENENYSRNYLYYICEKVLIFPAFGAK